MDFDGSTYQSKYDHKRLHCLLDRVKELMSDGKYRTLAEIKSIVGGSEGGVGARLRDLRKAKFGAYVLNTRRRGNPYDGLWEYQLLLPEAVLHFVTEPNGQRVFL